MTESILLQSALKNQETKVCPVCNKTFKYDPKRRSKKVPPRKYCSHQCAHRNPLRYSVEYRNNYIKKLLKDTTRLTNGCMETNRKIWADGYAVVGVYGKAQTHVHRAVYMLIHGELPKDVFICHSCDNRKCINPEHLFPGTHQDNMDDCLKKGRIARGYRKKNTKVAGEETEKLLRMVESGMPYKDIANVFGICQQSVGRIALLHGIRKKTYRNSKI